MPAEVAAGINAADYANHAARFDEIAEFLAIQRHQAPMLWGRHDAFFDIAETLSWMQALPRWRHTSSTVGTSYRKYLQQRRIADRLFRGAHRAGRNRL